MMRFEPFLTAAKIKQLQEEELHSDKVQKRTPEQIEAIYSSGQNILVSASAGSGKTFVMVERIVDKILRGIPIDSLFIATFTVKAATELKERLHQKLVTELKKQQDPAWKNYLNEQIEAIERADIGTMDSFTQKLVSEYGYTIGIAPRYRILQDQSEQDILKNQVYQELFEEYMAGPDQSTFIQLVKNFSGQRKDSAGFKQVVFASYQFAQSTADPSYWLEEVFLRGAKTYQDYAALPDTLIQQLTEVMLQTANALRDVTDLPDYSQMTKTGKPTAKYTKHLAIIESLQEWADHFDFYYSKSHLGQLAQDLTALLPSSDQVTVSGIKYPVFRSLQDQIKTLRHLELIIAHQPESLPALNMLQRFVGDFSAHYFKLKKRENSYEFADIAHLAIHILRQNQDLQRAFQSKYHEVMVDEYQDNNHMQECLLELLANGHNRFMVGDIKQSIYRFRQADPQIFNHQFKTFKQDPTKGKLIVLKENFRSHSKVLAATNSVFRHLMDETIGDVTYEKEHELLAGSDTQTQELGEIVPQLLIYDTDTKEASEEQAADGQEPSDQETGQLSAFEVKLVVKEISRLHQEEGVAFSDITLLVRSRTRNEQIFQTFAAYGIPVVGDGGQANYLKSVEVMVMLDTLRTINNPLNDYALVALLKSPMFQFTEDQLARIALQSQPDQVAESFYGKLKNSLSRLGSHPDLITEELYQQIERFHHQLLAWRQYALSHSLYALIWQIYNDRFYFDYVGTSAKAEQAQANLYALAIRAGQFEQSGFKGLSRFIRMIDRILETDNDLADVPIEQPKDAVSVMTIHKSKGLEFPYVFIMNCDQRFSFTDVHAPVILNRDQGVGIKWLTDLKKELHEKQLASVKVAIETVAYQLNKQELRHATLSEQMRLLYVAMTRAEKGLYFVGKGSQSKLQDKYPTSSPGKVLPTDLREKLLSFQEWLLAIASAFSAKDLDYQVAYISASELTDEAIGTLQPRSRLDLTDLKDLRQSPQIAKAIAMVEEVNALNQTYAAAINLPTVRTPSQLKAFYQPIMDLDGVQIMDSQAARAGDFTLPDFGQAKQIEARQIGSAMHELMQRIPLEVPISHTVIEAARQAVNADTAVKAALDTQKVYEFFNQTELGQFIQDHKETLHREAAFASLKTDPASQEDFVLRGIIDGYILLADRIVVFDYKTDRYQDPKQLIERYQHQMQLYAQALRQAYRIEQVDAYLILLGGEKVEVVAVP